MTGGQTENSTYVDLVIERTVLSDGADRWLMVGSSVDGRESEEAWLGEGGSRDLDRKNTVDRLAVQSLRITSIDVP